MKEVIQVSSLMKSYANKKILDEISFSAYQGEILALLGTNGAGKTTTLECIEGLRKYENGEIKLSGQLGVQLQSSSLPDEIHAKEALSLFSKWNHTKFDKSVFDALGISEFGNKQYKQLSTGQKRRLHLAIALIGDPDIVILDEPTAGLDVEGRVALHRLIKKLRYDGKTFLIASHDMAEVEELCDRVVILKDGKIEYQGTVDELTQNTQESYHIELKTNNKMTFASLKFSTWIGESKGYQSYDIADLNQGLAELINIHNANNVEIIDLNVEKVSLENRFMEIAKEGIA
ncbi:ATP-binding cassette domain-containing protein [Acetobacterium paludosum]|uniref:ATP-binding cassette domain-containing protein n=1 Tax=Acetobacterium paludosum TaxID=52693 RepID=A0A923KX31_9FIRM|nr:ABC transporter ATP-binding protein [Acetobacterium paludosum]MBC3888798.1 ATP-binding cassette domain-containing protein [Acetobacterium paludosum]